MAHRIKILKRGFTFFSFFRYVKAAVLLAVHLPRHASFCVCRESQAPVVRPSGENSKQCSVELWLITLPTVCNFHFSYKRLMSFLSFFWQQKEVAFKTASAKVEHHNSPSLLFFLYFLIFLPVWHQMRKGKVLLCHCTHETEFSQPQIHIDWNALFVS